MVEMENNSDKVCLHSAITLDKHCNSFDYLSTVGKSSEAQTGRAPNDTAIAPLPIIPPVTRPAI